MQPLLPGYEHDIEQGAGLGVGAGRPKVCIHTTESPQGSYQAVRNLWRGPNNWGKGLPHFLADGARYVQLLPLNVGAYTLENSPGGADTNRSGPAIQVEICTYAATGLDDLDIEALARWLAALVNAGVDLDLSQHPTFYGLDAGFTLASYNARQRMSADQWNAFNGFCGHQHAPENAHWDPGKLDGLKVERLARGYLGQNSRPSPTPEQQELAAMPHAVEYKGNQYYVTPNVEAVSLTDGGRQALLDLGVLEPYPGHPVTGQGKGDQWITFTDGDHPQQVAALKTLIGGTLRKF